VLTLDRQARRLAMIDFGAPVSALTRIRVPKNFNGRSPQARRDLGAFLADRTRDLPRHGIGERAGGRGPQMPAGIEAEIAALRAKMKAHPCHSCPDREDHARWAERWFKLQRDASTLERRVESRTNTVARQFDRVCNVLTALGYLDDDGVTETGRPLMRLYSELDLVASESLRAGIFDGLRPSELAAVLSTLVFEARRSDDATAPRVPGGRVQDAAGALVRLWGELDALERDNRLDFLRPPDLGFAYAAFRWAEGDDLDDVLKGIDLAAGDFVRWMKQLIDLCGQVANATIDSQVRSNARAAIDLLKRGVVAYSGLD
jgi:ATP-dependent RNA helicase HelY